MLSKVDELEICHVHRVGDQDLAAARHLTDACRVVDGEADVALAGRLSATPVHTHSDEHLAAVGPLRAEERPLCRDRCGSRLSRLDEGCEELVAAAVDHLSSVCGDRSGDQPAVLFEHLGVPRPEPLEQLRRSLDVGEEERQLLGDRAGHCKRL